MRRAARFTPILATLALVAACGDDGGKQAFSDEDSLLRYVDADTPYVFAALQPVPDDVYDKLQPKTDEMLAQYQAILSAVIRNPDTDDEDSGLSQMDEEERERIAAVASRLLGLFSSEGLEEAGIGRGATMVLHGAGLLPVMRLTLEDPDAFEATLADLEAEAGASMTTAEIDNVRYRFAGGDTARVIVGVVDGNMVATVVPATISDDNLRAVLGLSLPARSIAETDTLQTMATDYGLTPYFGGFMDFTRVVDAVLEPANPIDAALMNMGGSPGDGLSDVCKAEIRGMAAVMPRLVTGYTRLDDEAIDSIAVLEMRSDIADGLATLPAPVPGLGEDHGGLFSFGMSIDLLAAREFYEQRLDALEADPYECELFANMQAGVEQGRAALNQPVPPVVYGLKGFVAIVDDIEGFDMQTKQPPSDIAMRMLLATDNAPGLFAMGSMFVPELATLNLQNDGKPARLESPRLQGPVDEAWVAMSNDAIAMAVGNDGESQAGALLGKDAGSPPPSMALHMDAGRYYKMIGEASAMQGDSETSPEVQAAVRDLMTSMADLIDRVSVSMTFTDRGMQITSTTTLAD